MESWGDSEKHLRGLEGIEKDMGRNLRALIGMRGDLKGWRAAEGIRGARVICRGIRRNGKVFIRYSQQTKMY